MSDYQIAVNHENPQIYVSSDVQWESKENICVITGEIGGLILVRDVIPCRLYELGDKGDVANVAGKGEWRLNEKEQFVYGSGGEFAGVAFMFGTFGILDAVKEGLDPKQFVERTY